MDTRQINTTKITVKDIPCYASIGIADEEKKMGQKLVVDVELKIAIPEISKTDNIKDTISYVDIYKTVQLLGQSKSFSLIETLVEEIAKSLLTNKLVQEVTVKVHKPHIPYKDFLGNVSVEVTRTK